MDGTCLSWSSFQGESQGNILSSWLFAYDGDGNRVNQVYTDGTSTLTTLYFMGGAYETTLENNSVRKYYAIAGMTVAMNDGNSMKYLLTDHLGSVVAVTDASGAVIQQQRYLPFGQVRTIASFASIAATDFGYTGQRNLDAQGNADLGLMDYKARMYDTMLGRFNQPDAVVSDPSSPQNWNSYSYVNNRPVIYIDPSGNGPCDGERPEDCIGNTNGAETGGTGVGSSAARKGNKNKSATSANSCTDKRDLTDWTTGALVDSAGSPNIENIAELNSGAFGAADLTFRSSQAMVQFYNLVHNNARYDVKWNIQRLVKPGQPVKLGSNWYEFSTPGNIMYGFYGNTAGFNLSTLRAGAGVAQTWDAIGYRFGWSNNPAGLGTMEMWGDTPDDYSAVTFGYNLYSQYGTNLTAAEFAAALDKYPDRGKMAVMSPPSACLPANESYAPGKFYNR